MRAYFGLLLFGLLTMWVPERWAWSAFQVGIFALAAWRGFRFSKALLPLCGAALWPVVQWGMGSTMSPGATLEAALDWLTFAVVFGLGCEVLAERPARQWFLHAISIFAALLAAAAAIQQYTSHGRVFWLFDSGFPDQVAGPFVNRNQFAVWVELILPVALYRACSESCRATWVSAFVLFASVVASGSRAGIGLALLEVLVILSLMANRRAVVVAAAAVGVLAAWPIVHARFAASGAETLRIEAVRASVEMIRDRPLTGSGLGTWSTVYPRYASFDPGVFLNQAHNDWLQFAAEGGIPFVLLFAAFAVLIARPAVRSIYGIGTIAFLVHALVDYPMQQRPVLAAWFFAVAAAAYAGMCRTGRPLNFVKSPIYSATRRGLLPLK